ncbi:MAG: LPXTG cell wall anchor domain-containing protein [Bacilli bacterium]|nr:LPXTG cell wall anchor domain-containing protein [Bacilli bacterium]
MIKKNKIFTIICKILFFYLINVCFIKNDIKNPNTGEFLPIITLIGISILAIISIYLIKKKQIFNKL